MSQTQLRWTWHWSWLRLCMVTVTLGLPEESRSEYLLRFGIFHIVFRDGEYRGFFAIMTDEAGAFIHLGTTGGRYAIKDVLWTLPRAQSIAANGVRHYRAIL